MTRTRPEDGREAEGDGDAGRKDESLDELSRALESGQDVGLSKEEAQARLSEYGKNEVPESKESPLLRLASKFWGLTAWMLELAMISSFLLQRYLDVYVIAALLLVNAAVGFAQEQRASRAVEALRTHLQVSARVLRDGVWSVVPAKDIVPGDVVRVRGGDFVPADLKMVSTRAELAVDQSALTGESMEVLKRRGDSLFSGTIVRRGEASALVVATGVRTFYGRTTELLQTARPKLHMEEVTSRVVRWLLLMVAVLISLVLAASYVDGASMFQVVPLALVLVVFAVPVALPAMFTVSMTVGSLELSKKGVLVTRLSASEDAASMDVLCADKTGTITTNRLSVASVIPAEGFDEDDVVLNGALASQEANQDPIDLAFLAAARERKLPRGVVGGYTLKEFTPFDPLTRRTEALVAAPGEEGRTFRVTKGSAKAIEELCQLPPGDRADLDEKAGELGGRGYRTLAVALAGGESGGRFRLCGLVALYDAPRPDSKELAARLRDLGVSVKVLTGDALPIAREIASEVGLGGSAIRAPDLRGGLSGGSPRTPASGVVERSDVFAEVYPEDKYEIVKTLQAGGHIVGMTGDGVNDAPALRQAEVGIAVSSATDVAKAAASAVLTSEGLSNIVTLIEVGRRIYQRIVTWTLNKIIKTFEVAVFVALAFLLTGYFVVSALDIVLLLFTVDFVTISLSTDTVRWSNRPDRWDVASLVRVGVLLGTFTVLELFGLLYIGLSFLGLSTNIGELQTFVFAALFFLGMFTVLIVRERGGFWASWPSRTLSFAVVLDMVAVGLLVTIGIPGVTPIRLTSLAVLLVYLASCSMLLNDQVKRALMRRFGLAT